MPGRNPILRPNPGTSERLTEDQNGHCRPSGLGRCRLSLGQAYANAPLAAAREIFARLGAHPLEPEAVELRVLQVAHLQRAVALPDSQAVAKKSRIVERPLCGNSVPRSAPFAHVPPATGRLDFGNEKTISNARS
jgi:hypothetical protein